MATSIIDHMVRGSRMSDRPLVRMFRMVVRKLRPPIVNDAMKKTIAMIQNVWPHCEPGTASRSADNGGYDVQPPAAAPEPMKNDVRITMQPGRKVQ